MLGRWDHEVGDALARWEQELSGGAAGVAKQMLEAAADHARRRAWQLAGDLPVAAQPLSQTRARVEQALLTPVGAAEVEPEQSALWTLQTQLCDLSSADKVAVIQQEYEEAGDWPAVNQLQDLQNPRTDHSWLWMVTSHAGPQMRNEEFCIAVRLMI